MYRCRVISVDEHHLSFVTVQLYSYPLRLLLQHQLGGRKGIGTEVSTRAPNYPESLSRREESRALPFDGLLGHSDVPLFALTYIDGPAVFPRSETSCPENTHAAGAAFRVVRYGLLIFEMHMSQLIREL